MFGCSLWATSCSCPRSLRPYGKGAQSQGGGELGLWCCVVPFSGISVCTTLSRYAQQHALIYSKRYLSKVNHIMIDSHIMISNETPLSAPACNERESQIPEQGIPQLDRASTAPPCRWAPLPYIMCTSMQWKRILIYGYHDRVDLAEVSFILYHCMLLHVTG